MRLTMLVGVVLGVLPGPGAAQVTDTMAATQPVTQPAAGPIWLRVIVDQVNLRSRPDANSLPVARFERDTVLRATGRDPYGWYAIVPPKDVFSFVAAEFVDRRGPTEGIVSVRSGALRVRVGSLVQDVDPRQTEVQALLERGAVVRIVGEQGEWLKIEPPEEVRLHVSDAHVEPISDEVAARLRAGSHMTDGTAGPAAGVSRPAAATRPVEGPDLCGPWGQRLTLVEAAIAAEGRKPLVEQKWDDAVVRLQPIAAQRAEPMVARLAQAWIEQLERRRVDQAAVRDAEEVLRRAARDRAQHEREMELIERARQATTQPTTQPARQGP